MPFETDTSHWSGGGVFTQLLIERLRGIDAVRFVKIEDAPATRSEADYNFISNELFVRFATVDRQEPVKRSGILPRSRTVTGPVMTLAELSTALTAMEDVGEPDYGDEGMLQYLRAGRIVPADQTRGHKLVETRRNYAEGA